MVNPLFLLNNLESYAEGPLVVVPVGAEKLEAAYLGRGSNVATNAGADVVVAYAHQSDGVGSIVGQPVKADTFGQVIVDELFHLALYLLLFLPCWLVVEMETHLAFLALDVGIV